MKNVAQVTENAYVGSLSGVRDTDFLNEVQPSIVVSLTQTRITETTYHHPLVDGLNYQRKFASAVETVVNALENGEDIVVHCRAGRSRSVGVLSTSLAEHRGIEFSEALESIRDVRDTDPRPAIRWHGKHYLDEIDIVDVVEESMYDIEGEKVIQEQSGSSPFEHTNVSDDISLNEMRFEQFDG